MANKISDAIGPSLYVAFTKARYPDPTTHRRLGYAMGTTEQRSEERRKVHLGATVFHETESAGVRCCIRDASTDGCLLVSSLVRDFPETIQVLVDGLETPMLAKIVWRSRQMAGLEFDWLLTQQLVDEANDWLELGSSEELGDEPDDVRLRSVPSLAKRHV